MISLSAEDLTENTFYKLMPEWKNSKIEIEELKGGITNKLYRVKSHKGDIIVRIYGDKTDLFITRDWEADSMERVAQIGISPQLVKYLPKYNVTIVEFIPGYVLKNEDFLNKNIHGKITMPIRKIHNSNIKLPKLFNPYIEVRKMECILNELRVKYPEFDIKGIIKSLKELHDIINLPEDKYTVCHNDLLADNFILAHKGYKNEIEQLIYLIDWEYAGMAPKYYDIADMFQEILVPRETEISIIEHYCQGRNFDENLYFIEMYKPFPDIYWFLWSLIQANISKIKFDFYDYGKTKFLNAKKNIQFLAQEYNLKI